jgi:hypothetical protein
VDSLYVEYSEKNFRLTRCSQCGQVADKYIEFELVLVLLDILLHRKPAYRHLMYNRYSQSVTIRVVKLLPVAVVATEAVLKLVILKNGAYRSLGLFSILHAIIVTVAEHLIFFATIAATILISARLRVSYNSKQATRLFLAVLFPESFKIIAVVLHTFDSEPNLLVLLEILILSIQIVSFSAISPSLPPRLLYAAFLLGMVLRIVLKNMVYDQEDLWLLGGFT